MIHPVAALGFCCRRSQIKAKFRDKFQGHSQDDDGSDSDLEERSEEGSEEDEGSEDGVDADTDANEDQETKDAGMARPAEGSDDSSLFLKDAPEGAEAYQKASAWYYVSHSDDTNPYMSEGRKEWREEESCRVGGSSREQVPPLIMYLSFPWVCAYEQLCQIKKMRVAHDG